jgi:hypothetical protein
MTTANPILGELLLDGKQSASRLREHESRLDEQLLAMGERIEREVSLPFDCMTGLEILFYGFWYRELARICDQELFGNEKIANQYDPAGLAEMARIATRGKEHIQNNPSYEALQKGRFDSVVRLTQGRSDPTPQLQTLIDSNR